MGPLSVDGMMWNLVDAQVIDTRLCCADGIINMNIANADAEVSWLLLQQVTDKKSTLFIFVVNRDRVEGELGRDGKHIKLHESAEP